MIEWKPQYETGVPVVDSQHRTLFEAINKLETLAQASEPDRQEVDHLINFLQNYAATHFKFEESCMERFRCPSHEENKRAHHLFLNGFAKFRAEYSTVGPTPEMLHKLHHVSEIWIKNHICKIDVNLRSSVLI